MTCAHCGRDQICTQVKAGFSPFGHPTQVNASWVKLINLLFANEIDDSLSFFFFFFCDLLDLQGNLWVQLATQRKFLRKFDLRLLAGPFGQGLTAFSKNQSNCSFLFVCACHVFITRVLLSWLINTGSSPSLGARNYPIFLPRRFRSPTYFYFELSRIQIPTGT